MKLVKICWFLRYKVMKEESGVVNVKHGVINKEFVVVIKAGASFHRDFIISDSSTVLTPN